MPTTDTIEALGSRIADDFIAGLPGVALTPDEADLIERTADRLAVAATLYPVADAGAQAGIKRDADLDLSTLANVGVTHQIDAEALMRRTVHNAVTEAVALGLKVLLTAAVA